MYLFIHLKKKFKIIKEQQASPCTSKTSKKKIVRLYDEEDENAKDPETPFGEKKRMAGQMTKIYYPRAVEKS